MHCCIVALFPELSNYFSDCNVFVTDKNDGQNYQNIDIFLQDPHVILTVLLQTLTFLDIFVLGTTLLFWGMLVIATVGPSLQRTGQ